MSDTPFQNYIPHLLELRSRLLRIVLVYVFLFGCLYPFANPLYTRLATPLLQQLPQGGQLIATFMTSPFMVPLKLILWTAFFLVIPYGLYQLWAFVAPGLYRHERRRIFPLLFMSTLLFYGGIVFAFYVVIPLALGFFANSAPEGVMVMTDIQNYLEFVSTLLIAFGLAFQVPIITHVLIAWKIITHKTLSASRPYVVVAAFIIGMLLTPPDVLSQVLLAIPICLLFECGLLFSRFTLSDEIVKRS